MPRYFFDFNGGDDGARDDEGCDFATLELAYLDAYRSMVRIGSDLLLEQRDPSSRSIDIRDANGSVLMTVAFDEVFRRRRGRTPMGGENKSLLSEMERSRILREELREVCAVARMSVASARAVLERANGLNFFMGPSGS